MRVRILSFSGKRREGEESALGESSVCSIVDRGALGGVSRPLPNSTVYIGDGENRPSIFLMSRTLPNTCCTPSVARGDMELGGTCCFGRSKLSPAALVVTMLERGRERQIDGCGFSRSRLLL